MDTQMAFAVTTGFFVIIWANFTLHFIPDLGPWAGLAAWGCFVAAGGKTQGFQKTVFAALSGMIYVWVMMQLLPRFGGSTLVYAILIGAIAFLMVVQSKVPQLSFIPGAFIGAAVAVSRSGAGVHLGNRCRVDGHQEAVNGPGRIGLPVAPPPGLSCDGGLFSPHSQEVVMSLVTRRSAIALLGLAGIGIPAVLHGQPLAARHSDDQQPHMRAALDALKSARHHLEEAAADKAGHRKRAIDHVNEAITEAEAGIAAGAGH